jgi:molybdopterin synthase catalytic subunit
MTEKDFVKVMASAMRESGALSVVIADEIGEVETMEDAIAIMAAYLPEQSRIAELMGGAIQEMCPTMEKEAWH